jgi:CrcB protein
MPTIISISVFGILGLILRYGIDSFFVKWNTQFPTSTLLINVIGSFGAGLIYAISLTDKNFSITLQTSLLVGFCGGFTTFSAYSLQAMQMIERGKIYPALIYFVLSPILGLAAAFLPLLIFRKLQIY